MTIIVGRGRSKATQRIEITDPTVSREHCWLTDNGDGTYTLLNKSQQGTVVNGNRVMKTIVTPNTYITLSGTTTLKVADLLPLAAPSPAPRQAPSFAPRQAPSPPPRPVQKPSTPTYSIAHLEAVWDDYHETLLDIQRRQRTTTLLRSASPMFTLGSGALAALAKVIDKDGDIFFYVALALMAIGFILMFFSFFKGLSDNSIDEKEEATELFNSYYVCPNPKCHHFMGNQAYQIVSQHKNCPWCKCKFTTSK